MTRLHKKLLVLFCTLVCTLCLCLGVTACKDKGEHTHTFDGFWLFDGADGHYRLATCHPEVKSELVPHVDENEDNRCDFCDYVMHAHVDEDGDNVCDECEREIHKHEFTEEWSFNENRHWHEATCEHFIERSDYTKHTFVSGVCECGIKESEVLVYDLYKQSPEYELYFPQWLAWLKEIGVTDVEYTEKGDGIYHFEDGHSEVRFVGERTVMAKAVSDGNPVAHVWLMVTLYYKGGYYEYNGSLAIGLAETGDDGIAEISFRPIGGYSSKEVVYQARLAEAKDIAGFLGIDEKDAKPIPKRYEAAGATDTVIEVGEGAITGKIAEFNFDYSTGWNACEKIVLPYSRYYTDPLDDASQIKEKNLTYTFTSTGDNLFDYMYFIPSNDYSFAAAKPNTPPSELLIIEQNFAKAASGIYKIHFKLEGDATGRMYYWNEEGVNLGGYHETNRDGTPAGKYITSLSGGTAGNGHYSGGNFVNVVIKPAVGLRYYQLGLKTDKECKVTVTVERTGDCEENLADYTFDWSESDGTKVTIEAKPKTYNTTTFALVNVPAGLYTITFDNNNYNGIPDLGIETIYGEKDAEALIMYTNDDSENKIAIWESTAAYVAFSSIKKPSIEAKYRAIFRVTEDTNMLYVVSEVNVDPSIATLEKYELPTVIAGENIFLPVTNSSAERYAVALDSTLSGEYDVSVIVCGMKNIATSTLTVMVGNNTFTLSDRKNVDRRNKYVYSGKIRIENGDTTISIISGTNTSYTSGVTLTKVV